MGTVTSINACRCRRCGKEGSKRELQHRGEPVATLGACDACIEEVAGNLAAVRPVFDAMITAGVDREIANDTMTFMLDLLHPTAGPQ